MAGPVLNVGIIGCGRVAIGVHIPVLRRLREARVTAVAESDKVRRLEAQRLVPRARAFHDYRDLLRLPEVDAVLICLPPALHAAAAVAAMNAGKSVYLEKPIAASPDEARHVLEAWRRTGAVGMMGFNNRFNPLWLAARRLLRSRRVGDLIAIRSVFSSADRDLSLWKRSRAQGGGVILDLAGHHVDLLRFLLDREFTHVSAQVRSYRTEHDTATLELCTRDGLIVQSLFSLGGVEEDRIEFYGSEGLLRADRYGGGAVEIIPRYAGRRLGSSVLRGLTGVVHLPDLVRKMRSPWREPSYEAALRHFAAATREGAVPQPDLFAGYRSLAVGVAAEAAAASGRIVEVVYDEQEPLRERA